VEISPRTHTENQWVYRWRERNPRGDTIRRSLAIGTVKQYPTESAALRAAQYLRLRANPDNHNAREVSFGALIDRYIAEEMPGRHSTRCSYSSYLRKHIRPQWGDRAIAAVKPFSVREWLRQLPLAAKTKGHILNVMKVIFDCAMLWELITVQQNPMKLVRIPGVSRRARDPIVLTIEQFRLLLDQVTEEPHRTMLLLDLCLGLRCSELLALKWEDVDWEEECVYVRRAIVQGRVDEVKTKYSRQRLPLDPDLASVMRGWKCRAQFGDEADWIFASPYSGGIKPYSPWGVQQRWIKPAATRAGLGGAIGWHTLRHTYRTLLDETGAPLKVQQELMRHTDIRTTMNIYGAAPSSSKRAANSKVVRMVLRKAAEM
jgi:integrase